MALVDLAVGFVPGMVVAALDVRGHASLMFARHWATPASGLGLVWFGLVLGLAPWVNVPVALGASAIVAWIVVAQPRVPRGVGSLAAVSYGFYLWQYDIIEALFRRGVGGVGLIVVALLGTAAVATVSYVVVERPAIQLSHRIATWMGPRTPAIAVDPA